MASIIERDRENTDTANGPLPSGRQDSLRTRVSRSRSRQRGGPSRLSYVQERLWFLDQISPGEVSSNLSLGVRLTGAVDVDILQRAANAIVARHEILRTVFARNELQAGVNGQPVQLVRAAQSLELRVLDISQSKTDHELEAGQIATQEAQRPFDLLLGPLMRLTLLKLGVHDSVLLLNAHRIV